MAGSDSGGGAGIQADLKVFHALGAFGTTAITCITAQNPDGVTGVAAISAAMVRRQIAAVCDGFPVAAAKTGMLYSRPIIRAVAACVRERRLPNLVVDPVMVATSGARLLRDDAVAALCADLLPLATVITPNLPEAEALCGRPIRSLRAMKVAARELAERFGTACALKGGHLPGREVIDLLYFGGICHEWRSPRVKAAETHGTGCTFSAAVAAFLARGLALPDAVERGRALVIRALRRPLHTGTHRPLGV